MGDIYISIHISLSIYISSTSAFSIFKRLFSKRCTFASKSGTKSLVHWSIRRSAIFGLWIKKKTYVQGLEISIAELHHWLAYHLVKFRFIYIYLSIYLYIYLSSYLSIYLTYCLTCLLASHKVLSKVAHISTGFKLKLFLDSRLVDIWDIFTRQNGLGGLSK